MLIKIVFSNCKIFNLFGEDKALVIFKICVILMLEVDLDEEDIENITQKM